MKYNVFIAVKKDLVMLLTNLKVCRIDEREEVDEKIERSCMIMIVGRDKRESVVDCFDREAISVHDIDFRNVVIEEISEESEETIIRGDEIGFFA